MRHKAAENLEAATLLARAKPAFPNAAVTRAYFAAYQACWFVLESQGYEVPQVDDNRYWPHREFPTLLLRRGIVDEDRKEVVEQLYEKRVVADYYSDEISDEEAIDMAQQAKRLFGFLRLERYG